MHLLRITVETTCCLPSEDIKLIKNSIRRAFANIFRSIFQESFMGALAFDIYIILNLFSIWMVIEDLYLHLIYWMMIMSRRSSDKWLTHLMLSLCWHWEKYPECPNLLCIKYISIYFFLFCIGWHCKILTLIWIILFVAEISWLMLW